jgi:23S rRNA U2552 (ribose-2'-O)-methylase RlmE/FtsJ
VTERYEIRLSTKLEDTVAKLAGGGGGGGGGAGGGALIVEERMSSAGYAAPENVRALWKEKERIDSFFDEEQEACYYRARNSVFPQDQKGSEKFRNRAGDKLWEVHQDVGLFAPEGGVFFDVCGGPGAWSEVMLSDPRKKWSGFGMTLRLPNTPISDMWYSHLETPDGRWKPLWGADGTGNVFAVKNLDHAKEELLRLKRPVTLVMADGGFHVTKNADGKHMEHLQELYSMRIIMGELLACLKCLSEGGNWCCKLFDTFSHLTASVVFITGLCFENVFIVKPFRSRIVNSERYLVGKKLVARSPALEKLIQHVSAIHENWSDDGKEYPEVRRERDKEKWV